MPKTKPYHSTKSGTLVYHDNDQCVDGNNIETYYRKDGTGGLKLCHRCLEENVKESLEKKKG